MLVKSNGDTASGIKLRLPEPVLYVAVEDTGKVEGEIYIRIEPFTPLPVVVSPIEMAVEVVGSVCSVAVGFYGMADSSEFVSAESKTPSERGGGPLVEIDIESRETSQILEGHMFLVFTIIELGTDSG